MSAAVVDAPVLPERARPLRMTYDEWLTWSASFEGKSEWVNGEVVIFMPTNWRHADMSGFLHALLLMFVRRFQLGKVGSETIEMRLSASGPGRVPDILFVANEHLDRTNRQRIEGPADLVVEFISEDSIGRDRGEKFYEYQAGGVREYLIIDPREGLERVDLWRLGPDGAYAPVLPDQWGRYHLETVAGFWFDPVWLWNAEVMDPAEALAMIAPDAFGGIAPRRD